ncbi:MAG TPA: hypothetical protein DCE71_08385 [Parachlamydiales bacterium]|nr:hypothetical protein [Parachlamydiales bacterium]
MKGFSLTNVKYMVLFAKAYPDFTISQQPVGQIPWGHNILLLQKLTSIEERFLSLDLGTLAYARRCNFNFKRLYLVKIVL